MLRITAILAFGLFASFATAGEYNPTLNIGDAAPAWHELPGVDGKKHSLDDLKDKKLVVVVFTCNSRSRGEPRPTKTGSSISRKSMPTKWRSWRST